MRLGLDIGSRESLECLWMYVTLDDACGVVGVGVVVPGITTIACDEPVSSPMDSVRGKSLTVGSSPTHTPMQQLEAL